MPLLIDLTGRKIGRWSVIRQSGNRESGSAIWLCRCECGTLREVDGHTLRNGQSTNCGCTRITLHAERLRKHGEARTPLYKRWKSARAAARRAGLGFSSEWDDFAVFERWAKRNGYDPHARLSRIDKKSNFRPSNCTWVAKKS